MTEIMEKSEPSLGKDEYTRRAKLLTGSTQDKMGIMITDCVNQLGTLIRALELSEMDKLEIVDRMLIVLANISCNTIQFLTRDPLGQSSLIKTLTNAMFEWVYKNEKSKKMN